MTIPFIDLQTQYRDLEADIRRRVQDVLEHGRYVSGPEIEELEAQLAGYVGRRHAVGCSSGTDALVMVLMARGIGPGDAVFTTPYSFIAGAEAIALLGATPIYVDIDPVTYNLDASRLESAIAALAAGDAAAHPLPDDHRALAPRMVMAVDLFGLPADYAALQPICDRHGLYLLEDAAQSFGAQYRGRKACAFGDAATTSFFPAKPLGCYGDGGMIFTDDGDLDAVLRSIRVHGQGEHKYDNVRIGLNGRLDTLQAAILLAKFQRFPAEVDRRQQVAARYDTALREALGDRIVLPQVPDGSQSAWAQYTVRLSDRETARRALQDAGIPSAIYYHKPIHRQDAYSDPRYAPDSFPVSEQASREVLSLPFGPDLTEAQIDEVARVLGTTREAQTAIGVD